MDTSIPSTNPESSNARRSRRRFTTEERTAHLIAWKRSGLSAAQYGREHGLCAAQLYLWRKRTKTRPVTNHSPAHSAVNSGGKINPFIALRIKDEPKPLSQLRVTIRHGECECTVTGADDSAAIVTLLRAIKREVFGV